MPRRLSQGQTLVLATHNTGKLAEFRALLEPHGVALTSAGELGLPEPAEPAPDFFGNARIKALAAAQAAGLPALSDDSGFCVAALGGAPGVHSARWGGPAKDFAGAMARVNRELGDAAERRAWFTCVLTLAWPDGETASFLGRAEGVAVWPPRGGNGFGYDPMFQPLGESRTYGEMDHDAKYATSHRALALQALVAAVMPVA
jgi:XTP/dITP diphosphohydrolase